MSVPARKVSQPRTGAKAAPAVAPKLRPELQPAKRSAPPARTPAARPRPSNPPQLRRRARRGHHPVFWLFAGVVVSVIVVGLVAVNAFLVQTTYRMQAVQQEATDLAQRQMELSDQVASLSSPERVAEWARLHEMVMPAPGDTVILRVPGVASGDGGAR